MFSCCAKPDSEGSSGRTQSPAPPPALGSEAGVDVASESRNDAITTAELSTTGRATYFISGATTSDRLEPLLHRCFPDCFASEMSPAGVDRVDFVWQNTPTFKLKAARETAAVYSHLANAEILEDKGFFAKLQQR